MSNQDEFHTGHRTSMLHLRYLASFMDEIDREVVSLTDRAFKSLCIGDEAIYNDSEFSPSPVSCHKPQVEEISKKTQESSCSAVNKVHSYLLNGENYALGRPKKTSSKDTSHFAMFSAKKNSECTKMINGESSDKSAFLRIKRELSELSSDYHSIMVEQFSSANNNVYSDEKGYAKKSSIDASIPSRKSSKCKHKNQKMKTETVFLHSEFSPFLSWRDLNAFYMGQDHISEIMLSNRQSEWYDSPLYKELTAAHEHHKLHVTQSEDKDVENCPTQTETHQVKVQPESVQSTSPSKPPKPQKETQWGQHDIVSKAPLLATEKRCNSEKVESCVPWRKNKIRAKSAIPLGLSQITLPVCEGTKAGEEGAQPIEKEGKTIEDQTSSSSTPFNISQLLTPVILSRQGAETSEILQAVLPHTALDVPRLREREIHPSPEIKREVYKSMASSLLFNLKDNRKRVKAMYSPPKFKGLDLTGQNKELPLPEVPGSKDEVKIQEVSKATTISPACQKNIISPMSPLLESADTQNCSPHGYAKGGVPDDYLALSLLQSGGSANRPLKSNRSPSAIRVAYPSLQLYRKASVEESHFKANCQTVVNTSSQVFTDKAINSEHIKYRDTHSNQNILVQGVNEEQKDKIPIVSLNRERTYENKSGKSPYANSTKCDDNKEKLETSRTVSMQKIPVKEKESNRMEDRAKHLFSARQNNFIKSQRIISKDDDDNDNDEDNSSNADKVLLAIKDKNCINVLSRHSKKAKTKELEQGQYNTGFHQDKGMIGAPTLKESANVKEETTTEKQSSFIAISNSMNQKEQVKNESMSMKGNIYAKRALFVSMEQAANKTTVSFKKDNTVIDKYDLAKMALEEVIADREQRKLKSKVVSNQIVVMDRNRFGCELFTNREDQQTSMFESNRGTNTKEGKSQNNASAFKTNKQAVQMMSEVVVTKYDDSEESNRYKVNFQEKELAKNICHAKVGNNRGDHLESRNIHNSGQCEEELENKKPYFSHTPEVPPRRERSTSEGNSRVAEKTMRNKELKREGGTSVKTEDMESSTFFQSQSKNRGPVKGNVSALKEIYDKESGVHCKDIQMYQFGESAISEKSKDERPNDQSPKDKTKDKTIIPKVTVGSRESEYFNKEIDSENKRTSESPSKASEKRKTDYDSQKEHNDTQDFQKTTISDLTNNRQEMQECKVNRTEKREKGSDLLKEAGNRHNKYEVPCQNYVKGFISGLLGLSNEKESHNCGSEKVIIVGEHDEDLTKVDLFFEAINAKQSRKDSITVHDILEHSPSLSSLHGKQTPHSSLHPKEKELSLSHESERGSQSHLELLSSNPGFHQSDEEEDSCTFGNHESESDVSNRVVSPLTDVKKKGWVHCLTESARNLTQVSYNMSLTELPETAQPLSLRESLNEPKNGEENLERFKNCVHSKVAQSFIPDKIPQPNQPAARHLLSPLASQLPSVKEGKLSVGSVSVSEEEEQRSAVSTLSEGVDSFETNAGDTLKEIISCTAQTDAEGSKAPSERSGSVCSGNDSHGQNKPPVVPPKTEKAMRRAMKLTTRRIHKSEAKSKIERRGRSREKGISKENERRHYSTGKTEGDRSERISISSDRHSSQHSNHYLEDTLEPKTQISEKQLRHLSNKGQDRQTNKVVDSNSHSTEKQHKQSNDIYHLEKSNTNNKIDRMRRNNEKYVPIKQERRTQSLDRYLRDKHENKSNSFEQTEEEVNSELLTGELHNSTSKALPLRQNTIEHTYAHATNILAQSFPITQRKLLQDPDSGQYFLVDMPVQVKSKTFFDPETKSYVQLPIQSPEGAIRQAPPLEVMNTPPLVLYHGFVSVPFSTIPSQKSIIRTTGSMNIPDDLDDFETGKKQMQGDFYQTQEVHPYIEPAYILQEHTPEEEIDSVR
ncbi:hypothetical protein E1301_Tti019002 [Triplophysa tibetana]|uniref:DUF4585 domain-containing protein n=1 Tax=Triplophysa tibetana TaxID=1572043 RepID=A0A5A9PV07_9TELE|nr:hypothetical protein E1301_Tti019002 [Triplophysa tibetana]